MSDERRKILELLAAGKVTTDEADRLIEALGKNGGRRDEDSVPAGINEQVAQLQAAMDNPTEYEDAPKHREEVFETGDSPKLEVSNFNGRVELKAGTSDRVRVSASFKYPERIEYKAEQSGDTIRIVSKKRNGFSMFQRSPGVQLEIEAPVNTEIDLTNSNGRVEVNGIEGAGPVQTSNGRIVLEAVKGSHEVNTSNGSIEIKGMDGDGDVTTSNGKIVIKDATGLFSARTSNGSITFEGEMSGESTGRFETSNGSVKVNLKGAPNLKIDAGTSNGKISHEVEGLNIETSSRTKLVGSIGNGDGQLVIRTSNGSVSIEQ